MAIKNSAAIYIDGINRTSRILMPIKWGDFLDERLDEAYITISNIKRREPFAPLTPVEIRYKNELYFHKGKTAKSQEKTKYYVVADDNANESLIGKSYYTHEIYLIEVTKAAECVIVDTLTYTNDLGRSYTENAPVAQPVWE